MKAGDLLLYKPEKLVVQVVDGKAVEVGGITRYRVRDAKDKKADVRLVLDCQLTPATEDDLQFITYQYTDEETGDVHTIRLDKDYVEAVRSNLRIGKSTAITAKEILFRLTRKDTDSARRQFRAAVAYWIERGLLICSTSAGYFIAANRTEVEDCVRNKERQAHGNLRRAELLRSMDVDSSIRVLHTILAEKGELAVS